MHESRGIWGTLGPANWTKSIPHRSLIWVEFCPLLCPPTSSCCCSSHLEPLVSHRISGHVQNAAGLWEQIFKRVEASLLHITVVPLLVPQTWETRSQFPSTLEMEDWNRHMMVQFSAQWELRRGCSSRESECLSLEYPTDIIRAVALEF